MAKPVVRLPADVLLRLQETTNHTEDVSLETLVSTAICSFARYDHGTKMAILKDFWYSEFKALKWESISPPKFAHSLLDEAGVKPYSKVQGLAAILFWFANLPLEMRIALIRQYPDARRMAGPSVRSGGR
jgi:hypothetical protein